MRALCGLVPLMLAGCSGGSDKGDTGFTESVSGEGSDDERWWEEGDEDEDESDRYFEGEWERVDGYSVVVPDMYFESGEDVWIFVENLEDAFSKDGHEDDAGTPPSCVMEREDELLVCLEYIGFGWSASEELNPEAHCDSVEESSEVTWTFTEESCAEDPIAVCMLNEGMPQMLKGHYYAPISLGEAAESCAERGGDLYPLVDEDEDEEEEEENNDESWDGEYELGTRFVGYIFMDNSWGFATFEHFEASGENCRATAEVYEIEDQAPCEQCEFAKSFEVGEFEYEIDTGGCPRSDLDEVTGAYVTFGLGQVFFEDEDGVEYHSLWFGESEG